MKSVCLFGLLFFILFFLPAQTFAYSQGVDIGVTAAVLPTKYIYVDENQKISKILSNTDQTGTLKVIPLGNPAQELELTPDIYNQYMKIQASHNIYSFGEVYNSESSISLVDKLFASLQRSIKFDVSFGQKLIVSLNR